MDDVVRVTNDDAILTARLRSISSFNDERGRPAGDPSPPKKPTTYAFASGSWSQRVVNFFDRFSWRMVHFGSVPIEA